MGLENIIQLDKAITGRIKAPSQNNIFWKTGAFFAHSGDSWFWLAGLFIVWLLTPGEWHRRTAVLAASIIIQAVLVLSIKFSIKRSRPPGEWGAIYRNTDPHSFPSGHATRAFMLAFMAWGLGPLWFAILLALWAPLVSLARVYVGVHYFSDVLAGALLGILIGWGLLALSPLMISIFPWVF
ncbi:MAG: phosphatase PAP2 family protein [Anaerolineae bacterium]|nr:phosphatase PAP2 family protein [Anaerolineae bacterium]